MNDFDFLFGMTMNSKHRKINHWNQILDEILDEFAGRNLFPEDIDGRVRERLVQTLNSSGSCNDKENPAEAAPADDATDDQGVDVGGDEVD